MDAEIAGLRDLVTQRFNALDASVDRLTYQVAETNGRLRGAETHIAGCSPIVAALQERAKEQTGALRGIRAWDVTLVMGAIGITLSVLKFVGKL